jgi:hypothetical protein
MSYYEPSWDEDGNPEVGTWVREEPDNDCCNTLGGLRAVADVRDQRPENGPSGADPGAPF